MRSGQAKFLKAWSSVIAAVAAAVALQAAAAPDRVVNVATAGELTAAIAAAQPGDEIVLAAGNYVLTGNLTTPVGGTTVAPITVRAATAGTAILSFGSAGGVTEGFRVTMPWWTFAGLVISGACADDGNCEHAFHLQGDADHTVIRDNEIRDFNAQVKSNGYPVGSTRQFPDDVLVEGNWFHDTRPRNTSNPVTKLDVVGGRRWIVRANTIEDFAKGGGDGVSYGAFLKGNSRDGLFERNLVHCARQTSGGTRIGLSLGGGGTSPDSICEDGTCTPEHQHGTIRNNVIMDCSDVGIYLNKAADSHIEHNTLYATSGIDVRFAASSADVLNNLLAGSIRNRDGGTGTREGNLAGIGSATFAAWFMAPEVGDFRLLDGGAIVDQGAPAPDVADDFCGTPRVDGAPDIGAFEYAPDAACVADRGGGTRPDLIFVDGFDAAP